MGWWPLSGSRRAGADKPLDAPCSNDGGGSGSVSDGGGARSDAPQASSSSRLAANDSAAASASIVAAVAAAAEGAGPPAATAATVAADRKPPIELVEVEPVHVVAASMGVLSLGALMAAVSTYRAGSKSLIEDGINPDTRMKMVPVALKTLGVATAFSALLGVSGFAALSAAGVFRSNRAELPAATEAARFLRAPKAYVRQLVKAEGESSGQGSSSSGATGGVPVAD
mmetsp:Transcript_20044/g.59524  ORF Transcript_20044/g.59524 Transcript_20044/m.59524 type:complete len:227 (-) Transcript_20044:456-1136(-)